MRKKSINDLFSQFSKLFQDYKGQSEKRSKIYFAYLRAFNKRFGFDTHSKECAKFIQRFGKDYKV